MNWIVDKITEKITQRQDLKESKRAYAYALRWVENVSILEYASICSRLNSWEWPFEHVKPPIWWTGKDGDDKKIIIIRGISFVLKQVLGEAWTMYEHHKNLNNNGHDLRYKFNFVNFTKWYDGYVEESEYELYTGYRKANDVRNAIDINPYKL